MNCFCSTAVYLRRKKLKKPNESDFKDEINRKNVNKIENVNSGVSARLMSHGERREKRGKLKDFVYIMFSGVCEDVGIVFSCFCFNSLSSLLGRKSG